MSRVYPEPAELQSAATGTTQPRFQIVPVRRGFLVIDRLGRVGGIFISEAAARHFVFEESGRQSDGVLVDRSAAMVDPFRLSAA